MEPVKTWCRKVIVDGASECARQTVKVVFGPFPRIAEHIVETILVWTVEVHRRRRAILEIEIRIDIFLINDITAYAITDTFLEEYRKRYYEAFKHFLLYYTEALLL